MDFTASSSPRFHGKARCCFGSGTAPRLRSTLVLAYIIWRIWYYSSSGEYSSRRDTWTDG
eukprot:761408-Hanusia_phi.AAC.7